MFSLINFGPIEGFSSSSFCFIYGIFSYSSLFLSIAFISGLCSIDFSLFSLTMRFFFKLKGFCFYSSWASNCCASFFFYYSTLLAYLSIYSFFFFSYFSFLYYSSLQTLSYILFFYSSLCGLEKFFFFIKLGFIKFISSFEGEDSIGLALVADKGYFLFEVFLIGGFSLLMFSYMEFFKGLSRSLA